jgi:hypothetical protein
MNVSERACCAEIKMTYRNQKKLSTAMQGSRNSFFANEEYVPSRSVKSTMLFVQSSLLNLPLVLSPRQKTPHLTVCDRWLAKGLQP